jgi:hypothetical protein
MPYPLCGSAMISETLIDPSGVGRSDKPLRQSKPTGKPDLSLTVRHFLRRVAVLVKVVLGHQAVQLWIASTLSTKL